MLADENLFNLITPTDLAPGERKARVFDPRVFDVRFVRDAGDPLFGEAYDHLWREFGHVHEIEALPVLHRRLAWDPVVVTGRAHLLYEMILVRDRAGKFVAVRDHTAIIPRDGGLPVVVVHLSHLLIAPAHRGGGLAGWMRAWPLATAGACVAAVGVAGDVPTVLVAEMEHPDETSKARMSRLIAYEKAGFKKIDPAVIDYWQPDFRDATAIDADVVRPVPMGLVVRRVGREAQGTIPRAEVVRIVDALYGMYAVDFRDQDMRPVFDHAKAFARGTPEIKLLPPTAMR